jgi:hypothetical protein
MSDLRQVVWRKLQTSGLQGASVVAILTQVSWDVQCRSSSASLSGFYFDNDDVDQFIDLWIPNRYKSRAGSNA